MDTLHDEIFGDDDDGDLSDFGPEEDEAGDEQEDAGGFVEEDVRGGKADALDFEEDDDDDYDPLAAKEQLQELVKKKKARARESAPEAAPKEPKKSRAPRKRKRVDSDEEEEEEAAAEASTRKRKRASKSSGEPKRRKKKHVEEDEEREAMGSDEEPEENTVESLLKQDAQMRAARRKRAALSGDDVTEHVKEMLNQMEEAVNADLESYARREPATKKLALLPKVVEEVPKAALIDEFIAQGVLQLLKAWLDPMPNGSLPNVIIRTAILELVDRLATYGLAIDDLKSSGIGRAVALSLRHPNETLKNKNIARRLVQMWTRALFNVNDQYTEDGEFIEDRRRKGKKYKLHSDV
eukprot:TRINITY_DN3869_c0_g1_i2.p1 TRINITY_DN3869_c0_g1~~TRINITY_DN3869_c0_g1_i2.p1  ORF type:complete len:352 (+),score=141.66 TRINITY_DN3869_c0_g1_i2:75-1130(+)